MSYKTRSIEPLEAVQVASPQVWLRKDIEQVTVEDQAAGEPAQHDEWQADEVSFIDPAITKAYAEEHFAELWDWAEAQAMTPREYSDRLKAEADETIADLSETVSDNAVSASDLGDALAELSQVVSDMQTKE